ncbi:MAG TPA: M1 family aminopeptidase [Candidatus Eisenbacteria bacterium]
MSGIARAAALVAATGALAALAALALPARAASPAFESFLSDFAALRIDSSKVAEVTSLELDRGPGIVVLEQGKLALCRPVAGRVCALAFEGRGVFAFAPPGAAERAQVARVYGSGTLRRAFTSAVLIVADSTLDEVSASLRFGTGAVGEEARDLLRATLRGLTFGGERSVEPSIALPLLDPGAGPMFFAAFAAPKTDPVAFQISPLRVEPVALLRALRDPHEGLLGPPRYQIVSRFRLPDDTTGNGYARRPSVAIRRYTMDGSISGGAAFAARVSLELEPLVEAQRWLLLSLDDTLRVRSAEWADGRPAPFRKGEGSPDLWIQCDPPLARGAPATLRLAYDGPILRRTGDIFGFRSSGAAAAWYPSQDASQAALFDLTFHVVEPLQFVCVGEPASNQARDGIVTSHWVTAAPIRGASFNLGFFRAYEVKDSRLPPIQVLMSSRGHREMADSLAAEGEAPGSAMEKQVAASVANSLLFLQNRLGASPARRFFASEVAGEGGAFAGLIHLPSSTFQTPRPGSADRLARAREVARQWWGVGVAPATYHDRWLTEALAEFSSMWDAQAAARDNRPYFDRLEEMRKDVVGGARVALDAGAGSNWLAGQNRNVAAAGDIDPVFAEKGAWVLHMLRNLMLDLDTMSEQRFTGLLRELYQAHQGGTVTTGEFRALAEQHAGQDLGWFFDQWVDGTDVPAYKFAWTGARSSDTTWTVRCRVEQKGVAQDFRMAVPILVEFAGDKFTRTRAWVQGPRTEFTLPPLPLEPRKVVFDDMASVLCDVDNVKW